MTVPLSSKSLASSRIRRRNSSAFRRATTEGWTLSAPVFINTNGEGGGTSLPALPLESIEMTILFIVAAGICAAAAGTILGVVVLLAIDGIGQSNL